MNPLKTFEHHLLSAYTRILNLLPLKKMIVFESQSDMDDNPRAVFDYMLEQGLDTRYKLVWIVKDVKSCACKYPGGRIMFLNRADASVGNQLKLQYALSRAHWFVFSHPWWYHKRRKAQIVINVDHGIGIKGATANPETHKSFDVAIAPTALASEWSCGFWQMPASKIVMLGPPRNDQLFVRDPAELLSKIIPFEKAEKTLICLPTYRQSVNQTDSGRLDPYCLSVIETENDLHRLNDLLKECGIQLIIKPHPLQVTQELIQINLSNIHYIDNSLLMENDIQLHSLLGCCDAMLTDFSSIYFDYLLLDRPIGFLIKDNGDYDRGFLVERPLDYMPGDKIETFDDLAKFLHGMSLGTDPYQSEREKLNRLFNGEFSNGKNCEAFVEWLSKL